MIRPIRSSPGAGEPQRAVRAAVISDGRESGAPSDVHVDLPVDRDARDLAAVDERDPERAVRAGRQRVWARAWGSDSNLH